MGANLAGGSASGVSWLVSRPRKSRPLILRAEENLALAAEEQVAATTGSCRGNRTVIHAPNRLQICAFVAPLAEAEFQVLRAELQKALPKRKIQKWPPGP